MWTILVLVDISITLVVCVSLLVLAGRRTGGGRRARPTDLGPYEVAFLAGGPERTVEAALHCLWGGQDGEGAPRAVVTERGRLRLGPPSARTGDPVELALIDAWERPGGTAPARVRARAIRSRAVRETGGRLFSYGLALRPGRARARRRTALVLAGAAGMTVALSGVAYFRSAPCLGPLLGTGASALVVLMLCPARGLCTPAGGRRLAAERRSAPWATSELGAVVFDGESGLPDEWRDGQGGGGGGLAGLPTIGRTLTRYGKALDGEHGDDHSHGSSHDGGGHHGCGGGGGGY